MYRFAIAVVATLLFPLQALATQETPTILEIYNQFALTNAAASECIKKPDSETMTHYLANFQMVSIYALMELQKQYPDRSKEQLAQAMNRKKKHLYRIVQGIVREKGCGDSRIQDLIKRFDMQAKWRPGES